MRIVSLLPAATEICFALGLGNDLVGVSPECDFPAAATVIPRVSRSLLDYEDKTSAETSAMVGKRLAAGHPLYKVDEKGLREARPDVIVTQGLCEVCAPIAEDVRAVANRLPKKPRIVTLDPHSLKDVLEDLERVGKACGAPVPARTVVDELRERIERVAFLAARVSDRPRTVCLEWLDPLFAAGHWVPEMVELAGGQDVLAKRGEPSRRVEPKDVVKATPEVAVLVPCGFDLDRSLKETPTLTRQSWWSDLPAARQDRVWVADGSSYFSRPGPRLVSGLDILAHILHPEIFPRAPAPKDALPWTGGP
jgi:iron complex transport system substrate-binding protein